mgnify:CR=1 FL=1
MRWVDLLQHRTAAPGVSGCGHRSTGSASPALRWRPSLSPCRFRGPAAPPVVEPAPQIVRLPGVQRWVDQHGLISLGGFRYRVPIVLAGEPVEAGGRRSSGADLPP